VGNRRTVIIIAALVVALVAGIATYSYLNSTQERANKNARLIQVYKVKKDIPKGFSGDQAIAEKYIEQDQIPEKFRPLTSVTDLNTIKGKVSLTALSANQVVVDGQFVDPRIEQVTFSERIPKGQVAISLSYDAVHAVAGLLVPGDKVNMIIADPANGKQRFLFQNVNILAIGTSAAPQAGETNTTVAPGTGAGLITFAVPPLAAEKLVVAGASAYLTLVAPDNAPQDVRPIGPTDLFTGGGLTPYDQQ
jgi:pilus assembly protein CpaB